VIIQTNIKYTCVRQIGEYIVDRAVIKVLKGIRWLILSLHSSEPVLLRARLSKTWYPHSKKTRSYPATKNNWRSHTLHLTDPDVYLRAQKIVNGVNLDASTAREVNPPLSKKLRNLRVQFQIGILNNTAYRTCNKKTWRRIISDRFSNLI